MTSQASDGTHRRQLVTYHRIDGSSVQESPGQVISRHTISTSTEVCQSPVKEAQVLTTFTFSPCLRSHGSSGGRLQGRTGRRILIIR